MVHKMQRMALSQSPSNANANANSTAAASTTAATTATPQQPQPESESSAKTDSSTGDGVVGSKPVAVVAGGHKKTFVWLFYFGFQTPFYPLHKPQGGKAKCIVQLRTMIKIFCLRLH